MLTSQTMIEESTPNSVNVETRVAVIVCTRGRPSLDNLLQSIRICQPVPSVVVVVDASIGQTPGQTSIEHSGGTPMRIIRVGATPGLPHQRNIGVDFILSREEFCDCDIVSFLDDDVEVSPNYFNELTRCFDFKEDLIGVGAVDDGQVQVQNTRLVFRLMLVTSRHRGKVLSSGFATLPSAVAFLSESEWVPGFAMSFRRYVFETNQFDHRISFYGEDLEFQLRIAHLGKIAISSSLRVRHKQSPLSRDSIRDHWSYSDGFRWSMAYRFPHRVTSFAVIWSTMGLMLLEVARFARSGARRRPSELLGHYDFLCRLMSKKEVEKLRK